MCAYASPDDVRLPGNQLIAKFERGAPVRCPRHLVDAASTLHALHTQPLAESPFRLGHVRYKVAYGRLESDAICLVECSVVFPKVSVLSKVGNSIDDQRESRRSRRP